MYISENRLLKWAICSNAIYIVLFFLFKPDGIGFQKIAISIFLLCSVIPIFYLSIINRYRLDAISKNNKALFYLLMFWSCIIVIRAFSTSLQDWVTNFGNIYMAFAWLMPIMLILGLKIENWSIIIKAIKFMFGLMILTSLFMRYLRLNDEWILLLRLINFVLLIGLYRFSTLRKFQIYMVLFIYLFISILTKRRADFLYLVLVFGFLLMDKLLVIQIKKALIKYIILGFILLVIIVFTVGYEHVSNIVAQYIEFQDSRTFLFTELMQELNFTEKIIGRGSLGTYYSDYMEHTKWYFEVILKEEWWGDSSTRITTEVGYLQMILKGGFVLMVLNFIIMMKSSYMAIFKSKNKFIKRLGYFILILAFLSLIEFRPTFTPLFFILWMAIGTVWKKAYREMSDEEINTLIKFK